MAFQYHDLPLISIRHDGAKNVPVRVTAEQKEIEFQQAAGPFHTGSYCLSGISHFIEGFAIDAQSEKVLFHPQGFLIMEADEKYYTDRSGLPSYEIRFTLEGNGELEYRGKKYHLSPGEGFWIDCREHHYYRTVGKRWVCTILHFDGPALPLLYSQFLSFENVKFTDETHPNFEAMQLQFLRTYSNFRPCYEANLSCRLDILCTDLIDSTCKATQQRGRGSSISNIVQYVHHHFSEDVTLEVLMQEFAVNRNELCNEFKEMTGMSVKQYILALRMNRAKFLLKNTTQSVDEVSEAIGFHDSAYFIRIFKKTEGITPLRYRRQSLY